MSDMTVHRHYQIIKYPALLHQDISSPSSFLPSVHHPPARPYVRPSTRRHILSNALIHPINFLFKILNVRYCMLHICKFAFVHLCICVLSISKSALREPLLGVKLGILCNPSLLCVKSETTKNHRFKCSPVSSCV